MIKYKYLSLLKFGGEISLSFWETIIYLKCESQTQNRHEAAQIY